MKTDHVLLQKVSKEALCACVYGKISILDNLKYFWELKCSQYKNDAIQLKNFLILKLPPFSVTYSVKEKRRQFQTLEVFQLSIVVLLNWLWFTNSKYNALQWSKNDLSHKCSKWTNIKILLCKGPLRKIFSSTFFLNCIIFGLPFLTIIHSGQNHQSPEKWSRLFLQMLLLYSIFDIYTPFCQFHSSIINCQLES